MKNIKLHLPLVQDEDGYPPFGSESVWLNRLDDGNYQVDSIPFYSNEVAFHDVVSVQESSDGVFVLDQIVRPSGNSTVQFFVQDKDLSRAAAISLLKDCGINDLEFANDRYAAASISADQDYSIIRQKLIGLADSNRIAFQESLIRHDY